MASVSGFASSSGGVLGHTPQGSISSLPSFSPRPLPKNTKGRNSHRSGARRVMPMVVGGLVLFLMGFEASLYSELFREAPTAPSKLPQEDRPVVTQAPKPTETTLAAQPQTTTPSLAPPPSTQESTQAPVPKPTETTLAAQPQTTTPSLAPPPSTQGSTAALAISTAAVTRRPRAPFDLWLYEDVGDRVDTVKKEFEKRLEEEEAKTNKSKLGSFFSDFSQPIVTSYTCDGTLEADYDSPDHPDCSILINDFGASCVGGGIHQYPMSMAERAKKTPAEISAGLPQIPHEVVTDPYEQGYLIVPGLTDPAVVAAAAYDEYRRIEQRTEIRFPLVGLEAFVENPNRRGPHTHPLALERSFKKERARLLAANESFDEATVRAKVEERARAMNAKITDAPITIDIVYTYVNAEEPRFKNDLAYYEKWRVPKPTTLNFVQKRERYNVNKRARFAHPMPLALMWETAVRSLPKEFTDGLLESTPNATLLQELQFKFRDYVEATVSNVSDEAKELLAQPFNLSPQKQAKLFSKHNQRFRDYNEIMYSLRSLYRHLIAPVERATKEGPFADTNANPAPPPTKGSASAAASGGKSSDVIGISNNFGNVYIVVSNKDQAPAWLRTSEGVSTVDDTGKRVPRALLGKVRMVEHSEVFPNATRSLPNFNSNAIDTVLHRIKGLGRHFIFMNNDYFTTRPVSFFDYFMPVVVGGEVRFVTKPSPERTVPSVIKPSAPTFFDSPGLTANFFVTQMASMNMLRNIMTPNASVVPYVVTYGHYIHLFDRLHVIRMFTEHPVRAFLCDGRGQRARGQYGPMINVMALYYSMWYLMNRNATLVYEYHYNFGLGDVGNMTALKALPTVRVGGKTPDEGKVLTTLWAHLYPRIESLPKVLAYTLNQTAAATSPKGWIHVYASDIIDVKPVETPSGEPAVSSGGEGRAFFSVSIAKEAVLDEPVNRKISRTQSGWHWILNAMSATVGLYPQIIDSNLYRFSPSVTKVHVARYREDYLKNRGRLHSVCVNDELPTTRDVPHYLFNMSQLLVYEVCMNYDAATMQEFVRNYSHVFIDTLRKYRSAPEGTVEFNETEWATVAFDILIDEGLGKVAEPRWQGLLKGLALSPTILAADDKVNINAFAVAVAERIQSACVLGVAHEQLALLRYSAGRPESVGRRGIRTHIDERYLLADATDPVFGGVYGADILLENLHILSEGTPESLYRNLTPTWERPVINRDV